jgi:hypothetical protein
MGIFKRRKNPKSTFRWRYNDNIEELYQVMYQRIEFEKVTLEMTQTEYDEFADDTDLEDNFWANFFRPTNDQTDNKKLNWLFAGRLEFRIKIVKS